MQKSVHACVVSSYTLVDPVTQNVALSLDRLGFSSKVVFPDTCSGNKRMEFGCVKQLRVPKHRLPLVLKSLQSLLNAISYSSAIRRCINSESVKLVVPLHLYDVASLPWPPVKFGYKLIAGILDIPVFQDSGSLDRFLFRKAIKRIGTAHALWASDIYKARLVKEYSGYAKGVMVCHNTPQSDYIESDGGLLPRDPWLKNELLMQGADESIKKGIIIIRAGAVGENCGIDETLQAMRQIDRDVYFLMMGRPSLSYKKQINDQIDNLGLRTRACVWDRPSDEVWKKALKGADVGHLIHGPYSDGPNLRSYQNNSSLSNNRLYQYLSAGIPILSYDDPRLDDLHKEIDCFRVCRQQNLTEDLVKEIMFLRHSGSVRVEAGVNARFAHLQKYNWRDQFACVEKVIVSIS